HPAKKRVSVEQNRIIKEDVVNSDDFFVPQNNIGGLRVALVHRQAESEVCVVIKIRARRNDPIDEAGLNQRDQSGHAEPRRRQCSGQRDTNGHVRLKQLFREELTRLTQTRGVVRNECVVDEVDQLRRRVDRLRIDPPPTQKLTLLLCQRFLVNE